MKYPPSQRTLGKTLVILSVLGILFSLSGIAGLWITKPRLQAGLMEFVEILDNTLYTTSNGVKLLHDTLSQSQTDLEEVSLSLGTLRSTLESVTASLDISATLVGDDIRLTIIQTQIALSSAASGAKIIDDTLSLIDRIPFVEIDYRPQVPLHISLEQVAGSLEEIPTALESLERTLKDTSTGLSLLSEDLVELSTDIASLSDDLGDAGEVLEEYALITQTALEKIETLRSKLPWNLSLISIFFTGMLLWLGIAQVNGILQGLTFWRGEQEVVNLADLSRND